MITRATEWMSGRWWATLAVALAFILVARTGTVGAPAEARMDRGERRQARPMVSDAFPLTERPESGESAPMRDATALRIGELEEQLRCAQSALRMERERSGLIQESHDRLAADLERLGDRVRRVVGADVAGAPRSSTTTQSSTAPRPSTTPLPSNHAVPMPIEALFVRELPR